MDRLMHEVLIDSIEASGFGCYICDSKNDQPQTDVYINSAPRLLCINAVTYGHVFIFEAICPTCRSRYIINLSSIPIEDKTKE